MKKRFFAFLLAVCLVFSVTAYADYYPDAERDEILFSELLEVEIDYEEGKKMMEEAKEYLHKSPQLAFTMMESGMNAMDLMMTMSNIEYIISSIDNSKQNNLRYTESMNALVDIQQILTEILKEIDSDKKLKEEFISVFELEPSDFEELMKNIPSDEEFAIQKKLNDLIEKYYNNQFGSLVVKKGGKEYTISDVYSNPEAFSINDIVDYYDKSADILVPLFIDMVKLRNEMAQVNGYNDYSEYAYSEVYPKDYTADDRYKLYEYTKEYIVPLSEDIRDIYYNVFTEESEELEMTEDEVLKNLRDSIERINPELTEAFDYMLKCELYNIGLSENKKPGAFSVMLDYFSVPFLFVNPDDSISYMIEAFVHEFGHFNAMFHSPWITDENYTSSYSGDSNLDVDEIFSQGLEMLFMDEIGRYYGNDAGRIRLAKIDSCLQSVVQGTMYDSWLEKVYKLDENELNADNINALFKGVCEEYGLADAIMIPNSKGLEWIGLHHNFEVPFYYVSYAVSAVTALEIFSQAESDRTAAIDKYMKLTAKGSRVEFKSVLKECGYADIFTEETFKNISDSVRDYIGVGYEDVKEEEWFYPYVIRIANFTEPKEEGKYSPADNATRLMFVETLGRMEEDVNGIETLESPFKDVDSSYVAWAHKEGIVAGIEKDKFGGDQFVTREQILSFLYRMAGEPEVTGEIEFADAKEVSSWAYDAVLWAQQNGIASGYTDNTIRPKNNITRGEAAKFLADAYAVYY